jgi:hypothetical protein
MAEPTQLQKLVQFTIKERDFREVCDFMHLPPRDVEALIVEARAQGHEIDVRGHSIRVALAEDRQVDLGLKPEAKSYAIGAMGDLHAGSRYCRWDAVKDYVHHAYEKHGVRDIFQAGDLTEGIYRHASFERSNEGIEDQTAEMAEHLPKLKGLTYHAITGNHDITWMEKAGISPGKTYMRVFREMGREDLRVYGDRSAYIDFNGVRIHLWHPGGGGAYALSYNLQNKVLSYPPGQKPQITIAGHWHTAGYFPLRGVHAILAGAWQGGGGQFPKSMKQRVPATIGSWILKYSTTSEGSIRNFEPILRSYFEREDLWIAGKRETPAEGDLGRQVTRGNWREVQVKDPTKIIF